MSEKNKTFVAFTRRYSQKYINVAGIMGALFLFTSCAVFNNSSFGGLDKNIEAAIQNTNDKGYPVLAQVPQKPTDLRSTQEWADLQKFLEGQGRTLDINPNAAIPPDGLPDITWAANNLDKIQSNPKSAIAPNEDIAAWAARVRAMLK